MVLRVILSPWPAERYIRSFKIDVLSLIKDHNYLVKDKDQCSCHWNKEWKLRCCQIVFEDALRGLNSMESDLESSSDIVLCSCQKSQPCFLLRRFFLFLKCSWSFDMQFAKNRFLYLSRSNLLVQWMSFCLRSLNYYGFLLRNHF